MVRSYQLTLCVAAQLLISPSVSPLWKPHCHRDHLKRVPKLDGRRLDHKTLEEIRLRFIHPVQGSQQPEDVVRALGLGKCCIYNWLAAYRSGGLGALKAKKLLGQPMKLRRLPLKGLYDLVTTQTPLHHRFEFALWTLEAAYWLIAERFRAKLSRCSIPHAPTGSQLPASAAPWL